MEGKKDTWGIFDSHSCIKALSRFKATIKCSAKFVFSGIEYSGPPRGRSEVATGLSLRRDKVSRRRRLHGWHRC